MKTQTFNNNISWYPLGWFVVFLILPFLLYTFISDLSVLNSILVSFSFLTVTVQYLEKKFKTIIIENDQLQVKHIFTSNTKVALSDIKYAKLIKNNQVNRLLFGTGRQSVELYGKWGFEILDVKNPELFLKELKQKSGHFS